MSLVRRVAVVALVVALVAAGTALAGRCDPRRKLTPADQARAAAMLLRTTDLGRGYSPLPGPSTWTPQKCAALDESVLTLTGEALCAELDGPERARGRRGTGLCDGRRRRQVVAASSWGRSASNASRLRPGAHR